MESTCEVEDNLCGKGRMVGATSGIDGRETASGSEGQALGSKTPKGCLDRFLAGEGPGREQV